MLGIKTWAENGDEMSLDAIIAKSGSIRMVVVDKTCNSGDGCKCDGGRNCGGRGDVCGGERGKNVGVAGPGRCCWDGMRWVGGFGGRLLSLLLFLLLFEVVVLSALRL